MSDRTYLYGLHAVRAAVQYEIERIGEVWVDRQRRDDKLQRLVSKLAGAGVAIQRVDRAALDKMADGQVHQGIVASYRGEGPRDEKDLEALLDGLDQPPFLLVLDQVQDPHNLGACLRSADAAGVHAVIVPKDRAVGLTPVVHKVSAGASHTLPLVQVTNLARTLKALKDRGIWLYGAAGEADASVYDTDLRGPVAIVMGAEESGLRRLTREHCDGLVSIPMPGRVESLNVSVATGVMLFEALRQRRQRIDKRGD